MPQPEVIISAGAARRVAHLLQHAAAKLHVFADMLTQRDNAKTGVNLRKVEVDLGEATKEELHAAERAIEQTTRTALVSLKELGGVVDSTAKAYEEVLNALDKARGVE